MMRMKDLVPTMSWKGRQALMMFKQTLKDITGKRNRFGDRLTVTDEVICYYGTPKTPLKDRVLLFKSKGHIVNQGLIGFVNYLGGAAINYAASYQFGTGSDGAPTVPSIRLGTGGSVTTGATTSLTSREDTAPDSANGTISSPGSSYRIAWTATWNAGSLSAITVSELGLWLYIDASINAFGGTVTGAVAFFSRLSDADGDFSSFVVNTSVPLTIEWRLTFTFA